ncbi:acyl-CoA dehydrogenase family protein [Mycolicibacterium rhodesiae]|uniref:Acyl-CoA dehydrogenase n=1 Tax=Mycolicibacterium rhodesiae TaxID=36814 RepID=A0A1X0IVU6_MYCRH|nr:acyl-CoA dehydrogenase family protein [Mycolicibacterium rhodesiae]MCV7343278.1 acyl-CoA dehydrogenase [Mycolicibacterium rhodesiae]ORB53164.1 acyl-CoA dehydrogenase [Mycolicibacterium rhodesiae]
MTTTPLATNAVPAVDPDLVAMMDAVFADHQRSGPSHGTGGRACLDRALWHRLESLGLARLTGSEQSGGSGAGWHEAAVLLTAAARHGIRTPVGEHDLLACWLLEAAGQPLDDAVRTVHLRGRDAEHDAPVAWAAEVDRIVVVWWTGDEYRLADVERATMSVTEGANLIGEPRDTVRAELAATAGVPVSEALVGRLMRRAALIRSIQVCAALERAVELSIEHVTARVQFGRPLAKFQAIQNLISDAAAEAALARAATEAALDVAVATEWDSVNLDFLIATARSCAGHAASVVTRNAHQVHGAIGTTREHRLHEFTRAALAWRSEYGSVRHWDEQVAAAATAAGPEGLWALIADSR